MGLFSALKEALWNSDSSNREDIHEMDTLEKQTRGKVEAYEKMLSVSSKKGGAQGKLSKNLEVKQQEKITQPNKADTKESVEKEQDER